jgi:hypothetical protein
MIVQSRAIIALKKPINSTFLWKNLEFKTFFEKSGFWVRFPPGPRQKACFYGLFYFAVWCAASE